MNMLLKISLVFCIIFNSCEKLINKEQKESEKKIYSKEEKLTMFDTMQSQLVKEIRIKKNFSPLRKFSDEHSGFTVDIGIHTGENLIGGKFQKNDLSQLEQNVSIEELLRLIEFGRKQIYGNSIDYGLVANRFEYGLGFFFLEKEGKWIVRDFSRLRPERE